MHNSICPPMRFPDGSKYVLKGRGPFVRHYIEFSNGRTLQLATRKALFTYVWGMATDQYCPGPVRCPG